MASLDEIWQEMAAEAVDLDSEGINPVDYWLARNGIDEDEFFDWQSSAVVVLLNEPDFQKMDTSSKIATLVSHGFFAGLNYGLRRKEDDEL